MHKPSTCQLGPINPGSVSRHKTFPFPFKSQIFRGHDLHRLGSRDVIGHVTTTRAVGGFLILVAN